MRSSPGEGWEREHGWTRSGWGQVAEQETTLTTVLTPILDIPDAWRTFAGHYPTALDTIAKPSGKASRSWNPAD